MITTLINQRLNSIDRYIFRTDTLIFILMSICISCHNTKKKNDVLEDFANTYIQVYNKHQNFEKFLSLYDDSILLEDMINGDRVEGKEALSKFFNWDTPNFKPLDSLGRYIIVEDIAIVDNQIIFKGYFPPFQWFDTQHEAIQFTTWLHFNDDMKIIKQVDWINYSNDLIDYDKRKNSNEWIEESKGK